MSDASTGDHELIPMNDSVGSLKCDERTPICVPNEDINSPINRTLIYIRKIIPNAHLF